MMAISTTEGGGSGTKASLTASLAAIEVQLKAAQTAYDRAVSNKESSTIINKAKAALDKAKKAYELSKPQRNDLSATDKTTSAKGKGLFSATTPKTAVAKATVASKTPPSKDTIREKTSTSTIKPGVPSKDVAGDELDKKAAAEAAIAAAESVNIPTTKAPVKKAKYDATGNFIGYEVTNSDGSVTFEPAPSKDVADKKFTWTNPTTGQVEYFATEAEMTSAVEVWKYQSGEVATNAITEKAAADARAEALAGRTSAFDLLRDQFDLWGLGDLVEPIRALIQDENVNPSEYAIRLRQTKPYLDRFAANADRIKNGYAAINEAEYLSLEDQFQRTMQNYGLPETYYARGKNGVQAGFQELIANDVSNIELEDRIMNAQNRVIKSNPEVLASLKAFYPDITNGEILAYALDPKNAIEQIKRKITAAEIGGAALQAGLNKGQTPEQIAAYAARAGELGAAGVTKAVAQEGFQTVAEVAPRGGQLAAMYGESPYTQQTAEQEVFGLAGSVDAAKQRKKLVGLERASFAGQSGTAQGALGRERAGNF